MKEDIQNITPKILVVDDNPKNIQIVALILREFKYKIIIAVNGQNAIDLVNRTRPDLILLDVMMPGMDGFEACRIIKMDVKNENIPIIFLTALSEKVNIVKGFEMGGVDYIVKPFNKDELLTRIKTHLELKFTRDKLNKTTSDLIELNRIKDKMFSIIGHDLRSPVGSMKMMIDLILCDPVLVGLKEHKNNFEVLSQTANELYLLLENLLGWAKAQSGNLGFINENIELEMAVKSVFLLHRSSAQNKKLNFEQNIAEGLMVFTDLNMLKTVLRNLISNAIKFSFEGGTIKISAENKNDLIKISVSDTGVGIQKENFPKLFDLKQHITTYGTKNEPGSGLGLNLCADFINNNGGRIWVESEVGAGSTFFIELTAGMN